MTHTYRLTPRVAALTTLIVTRWGPASTEARQITQLGDVLPRVLRVLWIDTPDGYPTSTPGARDRGGSASTGSADKLGSLVAQRERTTATYATLCASVGLAAQCVALGDRRGLRAALGEALRVTDGVQDKIDTEPIAKAQRCSSPGDQHTEPWYRADCENISSPGRQGRCDACSMRRHRWLAKQQGEVA